MGGRKMYIVPRPIQIKTLENYKIKIKFENGEDVAPKNLYYDSILEKE